MCQIYPVSNEESSRENVISPAAEGNETRLAQGKILILAGPFKYLDLFVDHFEQESAVSKAL